MERGLWVACALWASMALVGCGEEPWRVSAPELAGVQAIVDGKPAAGFPGLDAVGALLVTAREGEYTFGEVVCTATLIDTDVVLTAAHCFAFYQDEDAEEDLTWMVSFAGDVKGFGQGSLEMPPRTYGVGSIVSHPGFELLPQGYAPHELGALDDLALVFLNREVVGISPAKVISPELLSALHGGNPVLIAGYGERTPSGTAALEGERYFGPSYLHEVGDFELRVGRVGPGGEGPPQGGLAEKCYGDSGGPSFLWTAEGFRLVGVTSRGDDGDQGCERAGVDTRVDAYGEWIHDERLRACLEGVRMESACEREFPGLVGGCSAVPPSGWLVLGTLLVLRRRRLT